MTASTWIAARAARTPAATALVCDDGRLLSWRALARRAGELAAGLYTCGVRRGDVVAALFPNHPDFVALLHAASQTGAALLPLNTRQTSEELSHTLGGAEAKLVVYPRDAGPDWGERASAAVQDMGTSAVSVEALERPGAVPSHVRRNRPEPNAPLAILYTSGTTGRPKGVVLDHANFAAGAAASAAHLGVAPDLRWLACMPLFHVGGLAILVRSVLSGAPVLLHARFDPERVSAALDRDAIGLASVVPTMLRRVLEVRGDCAPPTALRAILVGGSAATPELLESAWKRGLPALPTYGLTEACSQVATLPPTEVGRVADAAGRPLPAIDVAIRDEGQRDLGPGEAGEICVRGATVMRGYMRSPEETRRVLRNGWLHTGDVGTLDDAGLLRVLDRRSDLIVSGGENVRPVEVERVLESHPQVREAAVIGVPDPDLGHCVTACIVPADRKYPPSVAELQAWCRARLAGYKIPRALRVLDALPRTASGKLRRAALR